jgi:hypothetical protein
MAAPSALSPSSDASYLRRLLDRQPSCLIRVRLDGVLLACNDAVLSLFGVGARRAVLNTNLADRIVPAQRARWQEFTTRCWANGAASIECHLVSPDNNGRPVLIRGVALKDHPDGLDSLLLNLRDQSQTHRLEHSIQSAELERLGSEERQRAARDQIEEAIAERQKLAALADEHQAERRRLTEALEAQTADRQHREARVVELEQKVAESQRVLRQREREYGRDVAMLKSALAAAHAAKITAGEEKQELEAVRLRLEAATAEQARLQALVAKYQADRERIAADHQAAVDTLERSLARASEEATLGFEQSRQALAESRSNLAQALAEQSRMAAHADEQKREQDLMRAAHQRALIELETRKDLALADLRSQLARTTGEHGSLAARVEASERELGLIRAEQHRTLADLEAGNGVAAELRRQLSQASAEQDRLAMRLQEHELAHERLVAEHHRTLADMETGKREALDELRSQQSQAFADQRRLAARIEEHELAHDRLIAEHHRALAEMETGKGEALAELRSQLSQAFAEQRGLGARVEECERERDRMSAEHDLAVADLQASKEAALAELRAELSAAAAAEHHRLTALLEEHDLGKKRMGAEHRRAVEDLQASQEAALAKLRAELSAAVSEHHRLTALLEEHELGKERMGAEHRRAIADLQASKREAVEECERVLTEVQQALLVKDSSRFAIERRLIDGIDEVAQTKVDGERLAGLQRGWTAAFSRMKTALKDGAAVNVPLEAEHDEPERPGNQPIEINVASAAASDEGLKDVQVTRAASERQTAKVDVDPEHEPFDDADHAFVQHLLEGIHATPLPDLADPTVRFARAVPETQTVTTDDEGVNDIFDIPDDTFADGLMKVTPALPSGEEDS